MNNTEFRFMLTMLRTLLGDAMKEKDEDEKMRLLKRIDDLIVDVIDSKK